MMRMRLLIAASSALASGGRVHRGRGPRPGRARPSAAPPSKSAQSGVQLSAKTVLIPRSLARRNLLGVARDGTFKFRRAAGALARLKPGKVMLLEGSDAAIVKSVGHKRGRLLVHTKPAQLSDVISERSRRVLGDART